MSKKKPITHVSLFGKYVACYRCGMRVQVVPSDQGAPIEMVLAASKVFEKMHANCQETDASPTKRLEKDEFEWEGGLFVGSSSATIFSVMVGRPPHDITRDRMGTTPSDPDDFSRCYRLLQVKPEWRNRLQEVAAKHKAWAPLVEQWDRLTAMFEARDHGMYDFMKTLTKG